jgi:hypothetical protein
MTMGNLTNIAQAGQVGRRVQRAEADRFATSMLQMSQGIQAAGPMGMVSIHRRWRAFGAVWSLLLGDDLCDRIIRQQRRATLRLSDHWSWSGGRSDWHIAEMGILPWAQVERPDRLSAE